MSPVGWPSQERSRFPVGCWCLLFALGIVTSCGGGGSDGGSASAPAPSTWTIFVYGHADHNLTYSLAADIAEMNQATLGAHVNVVVAADWDASKTVRTPGTFGGPAAWEPATGGAAYPSGIEWYRIQGGGLLPTRFALGIEADFDSPGYLQAATEFALQQYPAQRYGIVLWDHGGSWQGGFGGDTQNGTSSGSSISAESAATAIGNALTTQGITGTRPLEFIAFDTCLMACPEVIEPMSALAKTYLACAEIDFGAGWDYEATLTYISANSQASATVIAAQEVSHWNAHHTSGTDVFAKSHVAIDLSRWDAFSTAMEELVTAMMASATMTTLDWGIRQFQTAPGYLFQVDQIRGQPNLRDVGQLVRKLATITSDATVATKATAVGTALTDMRLDLAQGIVRAVNGQSGLHMECALAKTYTDDPARLIDYGTKASTWNTVSSWSSFLAVIQAMNDAIQPVITQSSTGGASVTVDFTANDLDIGEASIRVTRTNPDTSVDDFGLIGVEIIDPGTYQFAWDLTLAQLDDGSSTSVARVERVVLGDGVAASLLGVPCIYTYGSDTVNGFVLFADSDSYAALFLKVDAQGTVSVLPLLPNGVITPVIDRYSGGPTPTSVAMTSLTIPASRQLGVDTVVAPAGTYRLWVSGIDVWGNEATVYTVPYAVTQR